MKLLTFGLFRAETRESEQVQSNEQPPDHDKNQHRGRLRREMALAARQKAREAKEAQKRAAHEDV